MKATIKEALDNKKCLNFVPVSFGRYEISCIHRGKEIKCVTTNMESIDDFRNSTSGEKDGRTDVRKRAYERLVNEIIRANK